MKSFLLYLWQLPQNLLGLIVILFTRSKKQTRDNIDYYFNNKYSFGVSLGKYIIINKLNSDSASVITVHHEHGHQIQSLHLGWFYLLIVGLPSFIRNIYDRKAHKNMDYASRQDWYYNGFPEKQADKYGDIIWQNQLRRLKENIS